MATKIQRLDALNAVLADRPLRDIARQAGVQTGTVQEWCRDEAFDVIERGELTVDQAARAYGVQPNTLVQRLLKKRRGIAMQTDNSVNTDDSIQSVHDSTVKEPTTFEEPIESTLQIRDELPQRNLQGKEEAASGIAEPILIAESLSPEKSDKDIFREVVDNAVNEVKEFLLSEGIEEGDHGRLSESYSDRLAGLRSVLVQQLAQRQLSEMSSDAAGTSDRAVPEFRVPTFTGLGQGKSTQESEQSSRDTARVRRETAASKTEAAFHTPPLSPGPQTSARRANSDTPRKSGIRPKTPAGDSAIPGSMQDVVVVLRSISERLGDSDFSQWLPFLSQKLVQTIARLEHNSIGTRVSRTDAVLAVLQHLPEPLLSPVAASIVPSLRDYFDAERPKPLNADWLATLGALGDVLSASDHAQLQILGSYYWHELETIVVSEWSETSRRGELQDKLIEPGLLRLAAINCHNIAAKIAGIHQQKHSAGTAPAPEVVATMRQLMRVSAVHALQTRSTASVTAAENEGAMRSLQLVESDAPIADEDLARIPILLDRLGAVPSAIPLKRGSVALAYYEAAAGIARALLGEESRIGAGFFNSGVTLIRVSRSGPSVTRLRALQNALGLWWTLRLYKPNLQSALIPGDAGQSYEI